MRGERATASTTSICISARQPPARSQSESEAQAEAEAEAEGEAEAETESEARSLPAPERDGAICESPRERQRAERAPLGPKKRNQSNDLEWEKERASAIAGESEGERRQGERHFSRAMSA